jgi:hypothetical protein
MGCSYDVIHVELENKKQVEAFIEIFNRELEDELYWDENKISLDSFEEDMDKFILDIDDEPFFAHMYNGDQLYDVFIPFLKMFPEAKFYADYECTFNNCGDAVYLKFEYNGNNILKVEERYSESYGIEYCPECDTELFDEICCISDYNKDEEYTCPNCGAQLYYDLDIHHSTIDLTKEDPLSEITYEDDFDDLDDEDED